MVSNKILISILSVSGLVVCGGGYYYFNQNKAPQLGEGPLPIQQEIKINFDGNSSGNSTNLLIGHGPKDLIATSKLTAIVEKKAKNDKVEENYNFIILNDLNIQDIGYIDVFNQYIDNLKINSLNNYVFYNMSNAGLNDFLCTDKFNASKVDKKLSMISSINKLSFIDTIIRFKKIANGNPTMKLFIVGDNVDTCNKKDEINRVLSTIGTNNNNIFVFGLNKTDSSGQAGTIGWQEEFLNELSIKAGIQYIKVKNPGKFSDTINNKIYPVNFGKTNLLNEDINTEFLFFDAENNTTAAKVTVYKQKGSVFLKHGEYTNDSLTQLSLPPGTYYFEIRDLSSNMIIRTEKEVINNSRKYKKKFYFRKTKTVIRIDDEKEKPVLGNFLITDLSNGGFVVKEAKGTSQLIQELSPGKYRIQVKTNNKFFFSEEIIIDGQPSLDVKFREENKTIKIKVLHGEGAKKDDVVVKIFNNNGDNIYTLQGGDVSATVGAGHYKIEAIDINSGSKVSREVNVSKVANTSTFELTFKSTPTIIDVGENPVMLRIYDKKTYELLTGDPTDKQKHALKSISGSRKLKMTFLPGDYYVDIFDVSGKHLGGRSFNVGDFDDNIVSLADAI